MSYRVVVEVPNSLAKHEKGATYYIRDILGQHAAAGFNWTGRVKSYGRVRGAETRGKGPEDVLNALRAAQNLIQEARTLINGMNFND
jgi:hypothetical protein